MEFIYDFVESIHIFIPIIAVISLVLIVYFCGIGRAQQPPEDFIERIEKISQKSKKSKTPKPSKFVAPKTSDDDSGKNSARKRQTVKSPAKAGDDVQDSDVLTPPTQSKDEWVTVTPKRKGKQSVSVSETQAEAKVEEKTTPKESESDVPSSPEKKASTPKTKSKKKSTPLASVDKSSNDVKAEDEDEGWETQTQKKKRGGNKPTKSEIHNPPNDSSPKKLNQQTQEAFEEKKNSHKNLPPTVAPIPDPADDDQIKPESDDGFVARPDTEIVAKPDPGFVAGPDLGSVPENVLSARGDGLSHNFNDPEASEPHDSQSNLLVLEKSLNEEPPGLSAPIEKETPSKKKKKKKGAGDSSAPKLQSMKDDLERDQSDQEPTLKEEEFIQPKKPSRPRARRV